MITQFYRAQKYTCLKAHSFLYSTAVYTEFLDTQFSRILYYTLKQYTHYYSIVI